MKVVWKYLTFTSLGSLISSWSHWARSAIIRGHMIMICHYNDKLKDINGIAANRLRDTMYFQLLVLHSTICYPISVQRNN